MIQHNDQPGGLRHWLHRHPMVGLAGAAVVLVVSVFVLIAAIKPPEREPRGAYYYDMDSQHLFVADVGQITPIVPVGQAGESAAPSTDGGEATGVRAYVYTCGDCDVEADQYIGWLEMYNPEVVNRSKEGHGGEGMSPGFTIMMLEQNPVGVLVRAAETGASWMPMRSTKGRQLIAAARRCDDGSAATRCEP